METDYSHRLSVLEGEGNRRENLEGTPNNVNFKTRTLAKKAPKNVKNQLKMKSVDAGITLFFF